MAARKIVIAPDGTFTFVHDDDLVALLTGDDATLVIRRASHVEPAPAGGWTADLSPVGGPVLGPFTRHDEAIAAEREWLDREGLERIAKGGTVG